MTCIVGLIDRVGDKVYIGGDSAGVSGLSISLRKDPKVFKRGEFIFGFTSSFRMGQLLMTGDLIERSQKKDESDYSYLLKEFIPGIRKLFKKGGYSLIESNEESGGTFLLGYKKSLYIIEDDFQVGEHYDDYICCGCGQDYAYGSLYATESLNIDPTERVIMALKSAEKFSGGVRSPFNLVNL
jgi:hypothetical protein